MQQPRIAAARSTAVGGILRAMVWQGTSNRPSTHLEQTLYATPQLAKVRVGPVVGVDVGEEQMHVL